MLDAAFGKRPLCELEELSLPVVEVADAWCHGADVFEPSATQAYETVELEIETDVIVQVVDADGEIE
jgi:hypothetical protein